MDVVLTPSWPSPADSSRPALPAPVRRGVAMAQRRQLRRAVAIGAAVMAVLLLSDLAANLLAATPGSMDLAPVELAAAVITIAAGLLAGRGTVRSEVLAIGILLVVFSTALIGLNLMPAGRLVGVAQLAIILVGVGLFLPWHPRWHAAGIGSASLLAVGYVLSPLSTLSPADSLGLLTVVGMASATSVVGHALWQARARGMLEQQFALRHLSRYATRQQAHVRELNRELNRVARRDSLTGVGNRLALDEAIAGLLDQGNRLRPVPFAIVLFDIDHFKAYNDEHGHLAGDAALGHLGQILRRVTRGQDQAFRYGGEEFLLLLPDVSLPDAIAAAERVRAAAETAEPGGLPTFTVSGGVALCDPADGRDPEPLLRRADAALYLAKRAGRNRIASDELSVAMQRERLTSA